MSSSEPHSRTQRYLTETQRRAIIAKVSQGIPQTIVAKEFGVHENTVNRLWRDVVKDTPNMQATDDWMAEQRRLVVQAVNAGLKCEDDPYRRGTLGLGVGKGLGMYERDDTQVAVIFSAMPSAVLDAAACVDIEAHAIEDARLCDDPSASGLGTTSE